MLESKSDLPAESIRVALNIRAYSHYRLNRFEEALPDCDLVLKKRPQLETWLIQGCSLLELGRFAEAVQSFEKAAAHSFSCSDAWYWLGYIKATCPDPSLRDGEKAVEFCERACRQTRLTNWRFLSGLAAAWAECGNFEKAVHFASKSLELAPEEEKAQRQTRVDQYRNRRPFRHGDA